MKTIRRQRGAVLILLFVALVMGTLTVILAALNNNSPQLRDRRNKVVEMREVKEALLAYALTYPDYHDIAPVTNAQKGPGRLPCSDTDNDGLMNCNTNAIGLGRLPQRILPPIGSPIALSDRYVGTGQQFWYAVAPAFRENSNMLNTSSTTNFTVDNPAVTDIAAVIIAPGPSLDGQVRNNGNQAARYLESSNVTGPNFVSNDATNPSLLNDMVETITVAEIMSYATTRVAQEIKRVLDIVGVPYPADATQFNAAMTANAAPWVAANNWMTAAPLTYTNPSATTATVQFSNCAIVFSFDQAQNGFTRSQRSC